MPRVGERNIGVLLLALWLASPAFAARPASAVSLDSALGYPLVVHSPADHKPLATKIRDAADQAWKSEIVEAGWTAPPPDQGGPDDRFDIYIDPALGPGDGYVEPEDEVGSTSRYDQTSYMGLPARFPSDAAIRSTVAHELNHASQFAMDAAEDDAFFEHTAVFVEQRAVGDFPTYGIGVADFQSHPERALTYLGLDDQFEYGAALWLMFLSERLGDGGQALPIRLWQRTQQASATNQPHFLNALDEILQEKGWSRARFFATFAAWRWFTGKRDDGRHFRVGKEWGDGSLVIAKPVMLPCRTGTSLAAYGSDFLSLDLSGDAQALNVELDPPGAVATVVPFDVNGKVIGEEQIVERSGMVALPPGVAKILVAITWVPADYDPEKKDWKARSITVSLSAAAEADGAITAGSALDAGLADSAAANLSPTSVGCSMVDGARRDDGWIRCLIAFAFTTCAARFRSRCGRRV